MLTVNTAIKLVKHTLANKFLFQTLACCENSKQKSAPPTGAPKQQAIPAAAPAAMSCLLTYSVCMKVKDGLGM